MSSGRPPETEELSSRTETLAREGERPAGLTVRVIAEGCYTSYPLPTRGEVLIGRAEDAVIRIDDSSISRRHAMLHVGPGLQIEDLGSVNGTRLGARKLKPGERVDVAAGDVLELGQVTILIQSGLERTKVRRLWAHGYFEGRLDDECARAARTRGEFAIARFRVEGRIEPAAVQQVLSAHEATTMVASYGPDDYEVLLTDVGGQRAPTIVAALRAELEQLGARIRTGMACYPQDGRTPEALIARAAAAVRGVPVSTPERSTPVVQDAAMQRLHRFAERIASGSISVLLLGETGVGKEVMAETIHRLSPRKAGPFLRLSCAALSESLLESELFGHEKGAFTGAIAAKRGLLETAEKGTLFLDEVGELPLSVQVKLLRVLEERKVLPVGSLVPRPIDVRLISATNRDLEEEIGKGRFRQDLYFRLNGISLVIPPLRARVGEIPDLAHMFLEQAAAQSGGGAVPRLSDEALAMLARYSWPGNIRELRNVIDRAYLLSGGDVITPEHLPQEKMAATLAPPVWAQPVAPTTVPAATPALRDAVQQLERQKIIDALDSCGGNQTAAARLLGISRTTLKARLEEFGLPRPRKR